MPKTRRNALFALHFAHDLVPEGGGIVHTDGMVQISPAPLRTPTLRHLASVQFLLPPHEHRWRLRQSDEGNTSERHIANAYGTTTYEYIHTYSREIVLTAYTIYANMVL